MAVQESSTALDLFNLSTTDDIVSKKKQCQEQQQQGTNESCLTLCISVLKLSSAILIPLMIAVFTIVISLQQQKSSNEDRSNNLHIADQQRRQDLLLASNLRQDGLLANFINEISELLLIATVEQQENNMLQNLIRSKTLTVLRQLEPARKHYVLYFLYDLKLILADHQSFQIDLSGADLNQINFQCKRYSNDRRFHLDNICLRGADMINATLTNCVIQNTEFNRANLMGANFTNTPLRFTDFTHASLENTDFTNSRHIDTDFTGATFNNESKITDQQLSYALSIADALLPNNTRGEEKDLIINGNANGDEVSACSAHGWTIKFKKDVTFRQNNSTKNCVFSSEYIAEMVQIIDISRYHRWIKKFKAFLMFSALRNGTVQMNLYISYENGSKVLAGSIVTQKSNDNDQLLKSWLKVDLVSSDDPFNKITNVVVEIIFNDETDRFSVCDNIQLTILRANVD